jgi:orotate phosphoribosyltransferase
MKAMTQDETNRVALARRIVARAHLTGQFTLRSGASSDSYFDKFAFEADPCMLRAIYRATNGRQSAKHRS